MYTAVKRYAGPLAVPPVLCGRPLRPEALAFFDLETTGLNPRWGDHVTVFGLLTLRGGEAELAQAFVEEKGEEPDGLRWLAGQVAAIEAVVHYNGDSFDLPFVRQRAKRHGLPDPLQRLTSIDLLPEARRRQAEWQCPDCRLETVQLHFGLPRTDTLDGAEVAALYKRWAESRGARLRDQILHHNADDLYFLAKLLPYFS